MYTTRSSSLASAADSVGFADSEAHLAAEIGWVAELLRLAILQAQDRGSGVDQFDEFSGLYVSERDIARFVENRSDLGERQISEAPGGADQKIAEQRLRVTQERNRIDRLVSAAREQRTALRLPHLIEQFGLTDVERTAFLCCLAPDLDEGLQKCFAYLQNEVSRKRPSVGLLASLCRAGRDPVTPWLLFGTQSSLLQNRLLIFPGGAGSENKPLPAQELRVPHSVIGYLAGNDGTDDLLGTSAALISPRPLEVAADYYRQHSAIVMQMLSARRSRGVLPLSYVWGPAGCDKTMVVEAVAHGLGQKLLRLDCRWLSTDQLTSKDFRRVLQRDARLHGCLLNLLVPGQWLRETGEDLGRLTTLKAFLQGIDVLDVILSGEHGPAQLRSAFDLSFIDYEIRSPSIEERSEIWSRELSDLPADQRQRAVGVLAGKFRFTPAQIRSAVSDSRCRRADRVDDTQQASLGEIHRSCRSESNQGLEQYAQRIRPKFEWQDIVLPEDTQRQLEEICNCVNHRQTVFGRWGFDRKFSLGKGLNVLFSGASGTGKTMSVEIIAGELELDLFKIDLSCVVSKYVGETERNLSRIFGEAQTSNSILFFDEADALFGKRSEVKDAHDRYANIEINYLLQKLDEYEGIIVLATNLKNNLDAAFTRRLNYVVEFPFPDERHRDLIWRKVFPKETPVAQDVDFSFLAQRFRVAGGNIKNVAVNSAFMAATATSDIRMEHIILALKREYQKTGKLCAKSEYGPYYRLVRETRPS